MKTFAVVLIANKQIHDNKFWVKCNTQEEVEDVVNTFSSDSIVEIIHY